MKVYYHDDLDGRGAAALINIFNNESGNKENIQFINLSHNPKSDKEKLELINEDEEVWIVDYSFSKNTKQNLENILLKTDKIYWIDHHITSKKLIEENPDYYRIRGLIDTTYSGAYLVYLYLYIDGNLNRTIGSDNHIYGELTKIPKFIQLIDDYDCWKKVFKESDYFKLGMDSLDHIPQSDIWSKLLSEENNKECYLYLKENISKGIIIKQYLDMNYLDCRSEGGYISEFEEITCYCMNSYGNSWVFGDDYDKFDLVILYHFNGELFKYSLYSKDPSKVDCSKLAVKYGGGGHPGAAGFTSPELLVKKTYKENKKPNINDNKIDSLLF